MKKFFSLFSAFVFSVFVFSIFCFSASAAKAEIITGLKASAESSACTLFWNAQKEADGYRVYVASGENYSILANVKTNSFCAENLKSNKNYKFTVRAYSFEDGKKVLGPRGEDVTVKTKLPVVTNISLFGETASSFKISWKAVRGAEKYQVYISPTGVTEYKKIGETENTKFTVTDLSGTTGYKIRIRAVSKNNRSDFSDAALAYTVPKKIEKIKTASVSGTKVKLAWQENSAVSYYKIYVSAKKGGKLRYAGKTFESTFTYNGEKSLTNYFFVIRPIVENETKLLKGKASDRIKGKTGKLIITVGNGNIRKGEYPTVVSSAGKKYTSLSSSDNSVIRVVGKDLLYAVSTGSAYITAKNGNSTVKVRVNVSAPIFNYMSCVYDVTNGRMIFGNRMNDRCYPASITKLITALVATKYMKPDTIVTVGNELNMVEFLSSTCGIERGEKFRFGDLLYGLLLPSGGDAAYTIAVNCARIAAKNPDMGYVEAKNYFVSLMNDYMKSIGATGTHCVNPHGYPVAGHYSTVHDLLLVARNILNNPLLSKVTSTSAKYVTALTGKGRYWTTTNGLINPYSYRYSSYAHGMKTGTVDDDYTGIISAATNSRHTVITIVIGCESYDARYSATYKLYNNYFY